MLSILFVRFAKDIESTFRDTDILSILFVRFTSVVKDVITALSTDFQFSL